MAEGPARYCGNCGNELNSDDRFCQSCGTPVHQAATVPTPEADVPVPPPPAIGGDDVAAAPPPEQTAAYQEGWRQRHPILSGFLVIFVGLILLGYVIDALGGNGGGGNKVAEKSKQGHKAPLFANGQFYTFIHKEDKGNIGDELVLGVLAGSESDSQIDKIARKINFDKSRYDAVLVAVLTKDDVTQKQIERITKEDGSVTGISDEDLNQAGALVISNGKAAESALGLSPGEHTYFTSIKEAERAIAKSGERNAKVNPSADATATASPGPSSGESSDHVVTCDELIWAKLGECTSPSTGSDWIECRAPSREAVTETQSCREEEYHEVTDSDSD